MLQNVDKYVIQRNVFAISVNVLVVFIYISWQFTEYIHLTLFIEFVISLNASDEFLRNRVMNLPENVVAGTHNSEEGLQRRLLEFRTLNSDDETVLNYFDELEIHPEHIGKLWFIRFCLPSPPYFFKKNF